MLCARCLQQYFDLKATGREVDIGAVGDAATVYQGDALCIGHARMILGLVKFAPTTPDPSQPAAAHVSTSRV